MKKRKKKESHNSNFSIDFPFPLSLSKGRRVYFNRSPIPIPPREVKIFFLSRDTSDESFISGARYVRYVRIEIRRTMKYPIRRGMAARFSILDFHPVIGSELSGAIITDRRDPWAVVNDQRRIFDSFRGGGRDLRMVRRSICLVGVMEKQWDVCTAANQYILYWNKYFVRGTTVPDV